MKKLLIVLFSLAGAVILAIGGYALYLYLSISNTADSMHEPLIRESDNLREVDFSSQEPLSFLILGIDAEESTRGRSDTMIVLTVNPEDESMKMVSIPRDTRTEMVGRGNEDKINHAFAFGGPEMAMDTVENFLDIPIDYYVSINMDGFKDIVDAVDGVTVDNAFAFEQSGYDFSEGEINLDGDEALAYVRMRKNDPNGDFGRNTRQRQLVDAVIHEGAQISSVTKAGSILDALGNNVRTNLTFEEMRDLQSNYRQARHDLEEFEISGNGTRINGVYYLEVPEEERQRISGELKDHLNVD
ncbi:LCP family glycopolymer transferase [Bacillus sp. FJAT-44742]|uniref:LCP family glycopolymer transferase n=1 Tax=Bacillus sp. FJAT-44742 TaxID=2014005 RepID=UPI000C23B08B|nr:LCP family protein [Bacillus sp. FJAT-44742]